MSLEFDAVIAAAGKSERMGKDKLFLPLADGNALTRTVSVFLSHPHIKRVIIVCRPGAKDGIKALFEDERVAVCEGGDSRTGSVEKGLEVCSSVGVLIHDGARPFVSHDLISSVMESVALYGSGVPALPVTDSVRRAKDGVITDAPPRSEFFTVQTPQGFFLKDIRRAYSLREGRDYTDDAELYARFIAPARLVNGKEGNLKLTTLGSYIGINAKIGIGYDLHRLEEGRKLCLGGISIPSTKGAVAHSDGDALIHALIDAMLSAIGERDIGHFFPDTDIAYKDIDSAVLLARVAEMYKTKNYRLLNVSTTVIIDRPKLAPYIPAMKEKLAGILDIDKDLISVAAKTTEETAPDTVSAYAAVTIN